MGKEYDEILSIILEKDLYHGEDLSLTKVKCNLVMHGYGLFRQNPNIRLLYIAINESNEEIQRFY